jgi:uncharacterized damage-inducible protein DinB
MSRAAASPAPDLAQELLESYAINERMNQIVLEHLDARAWRAKPPGGGRSIAAIFSHVHNIRRKWLRLSAPHIKLPPQLDRSRLTQAQARSALAESSHRCSEMLTEALLHPNRRIKQFHRDGWAKPWPAGAAMAVYMIVHEAHHRGQVCMLAHQLGFPLPMKVISAMWSWERLWNKSDFTTPR